MSEFNNNAARDSGDLSGQPPTKREQLDAYLLTQEGRQAVCEIFDSFDFSCFIYFTFPRVANITEKILFWT